MTTGSLLLVVQDGPDDAAGNATLNVVIEDREGEDFRSRVTSRRLR